MDIMEGLKQHKEKRQIQNDVALDIIDMIKEVFYGNTEEDIKFRANYGLHGCVEKIIAIIEYSYEIHD